MADNEKDAGRAQVADELEQLLEQQEQEKRLQRGEVDGLHREVREKSGQLQLYERELEQAKAREKSIQGIIEQRDVVIRGLHADAEGKNNKISTLTAQNAAQVFRIDQIAKEKNLLDGRIGGLETGLQQAQTAYSELRDRLHAEEEKNSSLSASIVETAETARMLEEQIKENSGAIAGYEKHETQYKQEISDLAGRLRLSEKQRDDVLLRINEAEGAIAVTGQHEAEINELRQRLEESGRARAEAETTSVKYKSELESLGQKHAALFTLIDTLRGINRGHEARIANYERQRIEYETKIRELNNLRDEYATQHNALAAELKNKDERIHSLEQDLRQAQGQKSGLEAEIAKVRDLISRSKQKQNP